MDVPGVFLNAKERRTVAPGEMFFAAGETGNEMFGLITGQVELRRGDQVLAWVGPGETFGELAIIDDSPRSLTAVAVEQSEIAVITRDTFLFLVHETPMFALMVMRSLARRIRELDDRV